MTDEINKTNQLIDLLQQDESIYKIDQPSLNNDHGESTINEFALQKSGYLNLK